MLKATISTHFTDHRMFESAVRHFIDVKHPDVQKKYKGETIQTVLLVLYKLPGLPKKYHRELSLENKHNKLWKKSSTTNN